MDEIDHQRQKGGEDTESFEELLKNEMGALERYVNYRVSDRCDAEDLIQDCCITAFKAFGTLKDGSLFKAWLMRIAQNKCTDYYRRKAGRLELPIELLEESALSCGLYGRRETRHVGETLEKLGGRDKQILYLYYFRELPQDRIAEKLGIPIGTVKSRLHYAKKRFKEEYPYPPKKEGDKNMKKKMPVLLPEYTITASESKPFPVRSEEIMGWFIVPREGEEQSWAMYDLPSRRRGELCVLKVVGRAEVHGVEGVEILSMEYDPMECNSAGGQKTVERHLVAQLTDTHCRLLAHSVTEGGVKRFSTFLDGDEFNCNWGFGENNCGNEITVREKGDIVKDGRSITTAKKDFLLDAVGRFVVEINGRSYDTVCVMDCYTYQDGVVSEQYLDRSGRTVLWRRFNRDDWMIERYKKPWSELLPENERLTVDGVTYVHWYDCITDYIL